MKSSGGKEGRRAEGVEGRKEGRREGLKEWMKEAQSNNVSEEKWRKGKQCRGETGKTLTGYGEREGCDDKEEKKNKQE